MCNPVACGDAKMEGRVECTDVIGWPILEDTRLKMGCVGKTSINTLMRS